MKKIKTLGFLVTVLSFLGLTACGGNEVSNPINSELPAPTESSEIVPSTKPSEHVHTLEHHEAVEATYLTSGNIEYWSCQKCHKLFEDADGSNELTNVIIPAKTEVLTKSDLLEAINQLKYVTLNANITCDLVIPEGKNVTLDLNGYTLTNEKDHTITNNGSLTIVGEGTIDNVTHKKAALYNSVTGVMVVNGAEAGLTIERSLEDGKNNTYYAILNQGEMTINEAIVLQNGNYSSLLDNGWYDGNKNTTKKEAVLVINGGTFDGGLNTIKNDDWGNLTITGGSFQNMTQSVILNWNMAVVENAKLSFKEGTSTAVAYILNGKLDEVMDQGIISIKNVEFASAEYKKLGYIYGDDAGEITVYDAEVLKSAVEIGLKVTIKLGCDITCDEEIVTPENVTIDLNGYKLN